MFEMPLHELQPSQLYLCRERIEAIEQAFRLDRNLFDRPLPTFQYGTRTVLTDGHSRAFVALQQGLRTIKVCREEDDLDWNAYRICVVWCHDAGVFRIADLRDRIIPASLFETLWIARCRSLELSS